MSDTPPSGRLFGHYEILGLIGRGGMGEVYRVRDTRKGRVVALKLLPKAFTDDPAFRARFEREAHIAATVNDPHIVPIHDYGEIDGVLFIEMAFIDGTDLRTKIRQHGPLDPAHALALIESIGSAVDTRPSTASSTSTAPSATSTTPSAPNPAPTVTFPSTSRPSCMTAGYKKRIPITDPGIRTLIGHNTTCGYAERVASAARAYLYRNPSSSSFDVTAYSSAYNMTRTLHCVFNGSYATCTNVGGTEKVFVAPDGATS